jgi:hypothetical protein
MRGDSNWYYAKKISTVESVEEAADTSPDAAALIGGADHFRIGCAAKGFGERRGV